MSEYPEHDKLSKVSDESQAQGDLLDWLASQGTQLMQFEKWDEEGMDLCGDLHFSRKAVERCVAKRGGEIREHTAEDGSVIADHYVLVKRHYEQWVHDPRSIQAILAEYHDIDQVKLEREKRAMLAALRAS